MEVRCDTKHHDTDHTTGVNDNTANEPATVTGTGCLSHGGQTNHVANHVIITKSNIASPFAAISQVEVEFQKLINPNSSVEVDTNSILANSNSNTEVKFNRKCANSNLQADVDLTRSQANLNSNNYNRKRANSNSLAEVNLNKRLTDSNSHEKVPVHDTNVKLLRSSFPNKFERLTNSSPNDEVDIERELSISNSRTELIKNPYNRSSEPTSLRLKNIKGILKNSVSEPISNANRLTTVHKYTNSDGVLKPARKGFLQGFRTSFDQISFLDQVRLHIATTITDCDGKWA